MNLIKSITFLIFLIVSTFAQEENMASMSIYEDSDTCSSRNLVLVLDEKTDCTKLSNKKNIASSIKFNGKCKNITDTSVEKACLDLHDESGRSTVYEDSDTCVHNDLVLSVGEYTNCSDYSELTLNAASIKINGKCQDINDTTLVKACNEIQLKRGMNAIFSDSDDCSKDDVAISLNELTNCQKLKGNASSVIVNGECKKITKTSLEKACLDIQEKIGYSTIYSKTDSCRSRNISAAINNLTDCSELAGQATSIKANKSCQDVNDTTITNACFDIQSKMGLATIYSGSDSCSKSSITHTLTKLNDCTGLNGNASSIKVNGKCIDITETSSYKACVEVQSDNGLSVIYSTSDNCSKSDETTVLTKFTKCSNLKGRASSVKIKGKCKNITDTSLEMSCLQIKEDD